MRAVTHTTMKIRESTSDKIFLFVIYVILILILIAVLYPLVFVVSSSFSSGEAVRQGNVWLLPIEPNLDGYRAVFNNPQVIKGFANTIFYTTSGTFLNVVLTIAIAYPLSRVDFRGRRIITFLLVFTMLFDGGLIPYYLTVKGVGILDTRWAMILPSAIAVWQVIIARTFFQMSIPQELLEASQLDGCSNFQFIYKVVLPLSKPIIAVLVLMYAVGHWNAYFDALIFLTSQKLFPLQLILRNILILNEMSNDMTMGIEELTAKQNMRLLLRYSLIVISSAPILMIYPFVQQYFVKGVLVGSLKA